MSKQIKNPNHIYLSNLEFYYRSCKEEGIKPKIINGPEELGVYEKVYGTKKRDKLRSSFNLKTGNNKYKISLNKALFILSVSIQDMERLGKPTPSDIRVLSDLCYALGRDTKL